VITLGLGVYAMSSGWVTPEGVRRAVARAGPLALLAYVLVIPVLELLWIPRFWGLVAGGVLFGPVLGGALSLVADLLGASLTYGLARGVGRAWVAGQIARRPRLARVVTLLAERQGVAAMAVLRVSPIGHFTAVSYAAGLAGVRPGPYLLGTAIGILPGAVIYPLLGHAMLRPGSPLFLVLVAILVVALGVTTVLARSALREPAE
jgi:uncharacterized membrane protein YdjX (TVP38/TMEM64 family)